MNRHSHIPQSNQRCHECGSSQSECWIFHNLRLKASFRRLCSNCVLKNNLSLFCPVCFDVYDPSPPPAHQRAVCFKCPSIAHLSCVSSQTISSAFLCPLCSDSCFSFFRSNQAIDAKSAKAIVAAARVAAQSMRRAAADARADAERKIKVAAFAKKQATMALERLAHLVVHENNRDRLAKSTEDAAAGTGAVVTKLKNNGGTAIIDR